MPTIVFHPFSPAALALACDSLASYASREPSSHQRQVPQRWPLRSSVRRIAVSRQMRNRGCECCGYVLVIGNGWLMVVNE
jgi:hypothetical protein